MDFIDRLLEALEPAIQIEPLLHRIRELSALERTTDADSFEAGAAYTAAKYRAAGLDQPVAKNDGVRHFVADGKTEYHTYTAPIAFRTRSARCSLVKPDGVCEVLGDRLIEPNTAILGTGYTGPRGITASVAAIQRVAEITPERVRGKIVFTPRLHPMSVRAAALKAGALAVVSSSMERQAPDHVRWHNTWDSQSDGWQPTAAAAAENFPGISLSPKIGERLLALTAAGPVTLEVITEGEYFSGHFPAVDLRRPGVLDQEVILSGHLFEQGAMDNASGVMTALAAAELLPGLAKRLERPQLRGVRAFHSHECYGVLALHATDPASLRHAVAHLNVDSVGADDVPLKVAHGLDVSAGATNLVFGALARRASERLNLPLDWLDDFPINCTILADPALGGIPTSCLDQPNHSWHTSRDRFDTFVFSPSILQQATLIAAGWTAFFALAGTADLRELAAQSMTGYAARLPNAADTALFFETARRELQSLANLAPPAERAALAKVALAPLATLEKQTSVRKLEPDGSPVQVETAKRLFPKVRIGGPLAEKYFPERVVAELGLSKWSSLQYRLKTWATGQFSVHDILRRTLQEHPLPAKRDCTLEYTLKYFQALAAAGLVTLADQPTA